MEGSGDRVGGFTIGAAFFGWLVATALTAVLVAVAVLVASLLGLLPTLDLTALEESGLAGAAVLMVVVAISYFAGGYVAGRMARLNGARAGFGVWAIAGVMTILLAVLSAALGSQLGVLDRIKLPTIPIDGVGLAAGGVVSLVVSSAITLAFSLLGGRAGERYHRRLEERMA